MTTPLQGFLADTWWYAMTARLGDEEFLALIDLRANQGFNAAQVVVGIPPETTPENPNAASPYGAAWTREGVFNERYLLHARERIKAMNQAGLVAIVYGGWGPQVNWLGVGRMTDWWRAILDHTSELDVVYCLTGESNLQAGLGDLALFKKYPGLIKFTKSRSSRWHFLNRLRTRSQKMIHERRRSWSRVLESITPLTDKPFIIHPLPRDTGFECVDNSQLLAANTAQTGHSPESGSRLYRLPLAHAAKNDPAARGFINLEPWYEGIRGMFFGEDQLFAYWSSMLAGAISFCYGAHGIWNIGDGVFLNHWGNQTFSTALALDTPRLLGISHELFKPYIGQPAKVNILEENGTLLSIKREFSQGSITFIPDAAKVSNHPIGAYWLPMKGDFTEQYPMRGQVVIIKNT